MDRKKILSVFFLALLVFILANLLLILAPFLRPIFWSAIVSFAIYPLFVKFETALGGRRGLAAGLMTVGGLLVVVPVAIFLLMNVAHESVRLYEWISNSIENHRFEEWAQKIRQMPVIRRVETMRLSDTRTLGDALPGWIMAWAGTVGNGLIKQTTLFTKSLMSAMINFFLSFFLMFFVLKDGAQIYRFFYEAVPLHDEDKKVIFERLSETLAAVIRGQLLTSLAQGALLGVIFWSLGLPLPLFFAAITFIASFIPVVGASAIWVPFVAWLFLKQLYVKAIILFLLGAFVISFVDNLLKPLVIGEKTKLPYLLLFLGILGGLRVYGLVGIFLAPAVLTLFFVLTKIYKERFLAAEPDSNRPPVV